MADIPQPAPLLVTQWAVCGIAAAAARFVPVPLLDEVIRERALQVAVLRTLRAHDRDYSSGALEPLWQEGESGGFGRHLKAVGTKIVTWPVRKYWRIFGAVRGVPTDVMRVVLVARTVDRRLVRGELADEDAAKAQAGALRGAIDTAMDGMDLRMLTAALADGLSQGKGLTTAAVAYARKFVRRDDEPDLRPDGEVRQGAERVTEVLERPEIARKLDAFDSAVEAALVRTPGR